MSALTVRIDGERVVASDDHGRTATLPPSFGRAASAAFEGAPPAGTEELTAGTLAALAEARQARPRAVSGPPAAWQDDADGARVPLPGLLSRASRPLAEVLAERHSERVWIRPRLLDLATLLARAARVIDWSVGPDGYVTTRRPVPSAGARHPLDVHVLASDVEGLPAGAWRFDALRCELVASPHPHQPALTRLGDVLAAQPPPAALVAVAHLPRTLSRYPAGLSLLWRDAGALLAVLHLCATDLGLASCIAGSCGALVDEPTIIDVGALLVGAPVQA